MPHVHFIGIGGVGMNGLAQLAVHDGYTVTGSDRAFNAETFLFRCLQDIGIQIADQDGSGISAKTTQVVFSTAIEEDNPDLLKAKALGIPLLHRAEFLKQLVGTDDLIAVAGTAGKTTTTGMLGWIFESLGKDPSVYNGAAVVNWKTDSTPGNVRTGKSGLWIIEADESDKSFLNFRPTHSIITNISKDHYELDELNRMFDQFESQTSGITIRGQSYDLIKTSDHRTDPLSTTGFHPVCSGRLPEHSRPKQHLSNIPMPGQHNLENAQCAFALCMELGFEPETVKKAIAEFMGIERRLERVGCVDGITIIDDYAHNPAKIAAAVSAVAETYQTVHAFWRPHGFAPLAGNLDELVETFTELAAAHNCVIYLLPVYYAGGTVRKTVDSAHLAEQLNSAGVPARLVQDYPALKRELEQHAIAGDAILGMGARDPELPIFAKRLVKEWKTIR